MSVFNKKEIDVIELPPKLRKIFVNHFGSVQKELKKHRDQIKQIVSPNQLKNIFEELLSEKNKKIKKSDSKLQDYDGLLADAADQIKDLKKELDKIKKRHTNDYDLIEKGFTQNILNLNEDIIDLKEKERAFNEKLNLKDQEKETELREQKQKHQTELDNNNQELEKYKGIEDELNKDVSTVTDYFGNELYEYSLENSPNETGLPIKYKIIKTISYLLNGLEEIGGNSKNERIFTDSFETNIALYISSLLVQFNIEDEKINDIIAKVNERLKKYNINEPGRLGDFVEDDKHEKANQGGAIIKKYYTLAISKKEGNQIVRKALVQS